MTVIDSNIRQEVRDRYLIYALSVISDRALPDVRDGLKPVQRRILYAMLKNLGLKPTSSHRKCAKIIGEVLGSFHPHGDIACYEALVRMAQDFSLRYPLVDGQGNFGSLDGDSPAAYRYTEARLEQIALDVVGEIYEETVSYRDNFDSTVIEPIVLPSKLPNLLMNGASGIAVGMATNIPPHNLRELIKALVQLIQDPDITTSKLLQNIKGPDFPTGCLILNSRKELSAIYTSGRGNIRMRGEWKVEEGQRKKKSVIITSVPYGLNKSQLIEKIADLILEKKVPQFVDIRDESTEDVRIVLELSSDAEPETGVAYLYKHTPLESNFSVNLTALVPTSGQSSKPELLSLKQSLQYFLDFRIEVTERKLIFEKKQLEERVHILDGLIKIFDALDEALKIVRKSEGRSDAATKLQKRFRLTEIQAFAVVDMRIYQLSKTNIEEIRAEREAKLKRIKQIEQILKSKKRVQNLVQADLELMAEQYGDRRKSKVVQDYEEIELDETDYVVQEEVYAIATADGWIKRIRQTNELSSTRVREGDRILYAHPISTLDSVAFITNQGFLYVVSVSDFPASGGYGTPIQKLIKVRDGERIIASFPVLAEGYETGGLEEELLTLSAGDAIILVSDNGVGSAITLGDMSGLKRSGKRIAKIRAGDFISATVKMDKYLGMITKKGSGLVISTKEVPLRTNPSVGVQLMGVRKGDRVIGAVSFAKKTEIQLEMASGKPKIISSADMTKGKRGLKGKKVVGREVQGVQKN